GTVFGESFAHGAARCGGNGKDANRGISLRREHPARRLRRVIYGDGVGHGADGGESAGCGGRRAGCNCLLVSLAGLAQVDVNVDESGRDDEALRVQNLGPGAVDLSRRVHRGYPAFGEQQVARRVNTGGGVNQASVADEHRFHRDFFSPSARAIRAMRMGTPLCTCASMTDCGPSATSLVISIPRMIGPGCMMTAFGAWAAMRSASAW